MKPNSAMGATAPVGLELGKTKQGGNDEESFVSSTNGSNVLPGRVHFARSRFCERKEDLQG
jgi:hypothetical protein